MATTKEADIMSHDATLLGRTRRYHDCLFVEWVKLSARRVAERVSVVEGPAPNPRPGF